MKKLAIGQRLTVGTKTNQFQMVVASFDDKLVRGPHIDGVGMVEIAISDIGSVAPANAVSEAVLKKASEPQPVIKAPVVKAAPKVVRVTTGESKFDKAVALAKANKTMSRKEFIELLVAELGMTPAGASTYASTARKGI